MKKVDKILATIILSIVFIFCSYQLFLWGGILFGLHLNAMVLTGITVGFLFCFIWLRDIVRNLYTQSRVFLIVFYLVSSAVLFIHMRTLTIPLLIFAVFAGLYTGRRVGFEDGVEIDLKRALKKAALFSDLVLLVYYVIGVVFVLTSAMTVNGIDIMLNFSIDVTNSIFRVIIIVGGALLLPLNYFLVIWSGRFAYYIRSE